MHRNEYMVELHGDGIVYIKNVFGQFLAVIITSGAGLAIAKTTPVNRNGAAQDAIEREQIAQDLRHMGFKKAIVLEAVPVIHKCDKDIRELKQSCTDRVNKILDKTWTTQ